MTLPTMHECEKYPSNCIQYAKTQFSSITKSNDNVQNIEMDCDVCTSTVRQRLPLYLSKMLPLLRTAAAAAAADANSSIFVTNERQRARTRMHIHIRNTSINTEDGMQHLNTFGWNAFIFDAVHCFMAFRCQSHVPSFYFTLFQFNTKHTANS